ncbi:cytochrome C [Pseudomonas sp. R2.Fl]|nr:cytochrome C [Pseudomonas sp. R2.Fl]
MPNPASSTPLLSCLLSSLLILAGCQARADKPATAAVPSPAPTTTARDAVARGEYLVRVAGCNDCHTAGYAERQGEVPTAQWLTGSPLGYHGPWGTTYASNLRLRMQEMTEAQWLAYSGNLRTRPIMPDFTLRAMSEADRQAIYQFVRSLGPVGEAAPAYLPPGQTPPPPYFSLVLPEAPKQDAPDGAKASARN